MSIETKTYIPSWLWSELEIFLVYPESKHKETLFVMEKEGYDITKFIKKNIFPVDALPISNNDYAGFKIGNIFNWNIVKLYTLLVTGKEEKRKTIDGSFLHRLDDTVVIRDAAGVICEYKISDIVRTRCSVTGRRIMFDDT